MKFLKRSLLILLALLAIAVYTNYPKLNILSGYSAKSMASSVFVAGREAAFTDATDNNFSPVNIAEDEVDLTTKTASASVYGFKEREAIYRDGLGCALVPEDYDYKPLGIQPQRHKTPKALAFPYGNLPQKDTVFANIDYDKLNATVSNFMDPKYKSRAVLVIYKDHIIAEQYAEGFDKKSLLLGWSMTKSLTSTAFGVLASKGKINLNDSPNFKSWNSDDRKTISIKNLLEMNSGLEWEENYETISDVTKMLFLSPNMTVVQKDKPLIGKPNQTWNYSSGTTNLLSGILRNQFSTHQEYLNFPYTHFIDAIGAHSMLIETDITGHFVGSSYGWATARDWAKVGLLYLHKGNWNGTSIFNQEWYDYAITPTPTSNGRYGAQIWLNKGGHYPNVPKDMFSFDGYQGQYVFVFPSQDLVVVRLGIQKNDLNPFLEGVVGSVG